MLNEVVVLGRQSKSCPQFYVNLLLLLLLLLLLSQMRATIKIECNDGRLNNCSGLIVSRGK